MKWIDDVLQDKVKLNSSNIPNPDKWKDVEKNSSILVSNICIGETIATREEKQTFGPRRAS